jgi:hypothetical protein
MRWTRRDDDFLKYCEEHKGDVPLIDEKKDLPTEDSSSSSVPYYHVLGRTMVVRAKKKIPTANEIMLAAQILKKRKRKTEKEKEAE